MLPSSSLRKNSKPTRSPLRQESEFWPQLISRFPQDQPVLTHPKLTSSTPSTSQPRSTRVRSKSPRSSKCAPRERKSRLLKLLSSRN
ncbi:UNVERIFIED_CONTAM: hypothetical protein GTU68_004891 [Idotea baltica]|nr:hypothetical protein [Idotea baltica]